MFISAMHWSTALLVITPHRNDEMAAGLEGSNQLMKQTPGPQGVFKSLGTNHHVKVAQLAVTLLKVPDHRDPRSREAVHPLIAVEFPKERTPIRAGGTADVE
jgi:hypothetical protein